MTTDEGWFPPGCKDGGAQYPARRRESV